MPFALAFSSRASSLLSLPLAVWIWPVFDFQQSNEYALGRAPGLRRPPCSPPISPRQENPNQNRQARRGRKPEIGGQVIHARRSLGLSVFKVQVSPATRVPQGSSKSTGTMCDAIAGVAMFGESTRRTGRWQLVPRGCFAIAASTRGGRLSEVPERARDNMLRECHLRATWQGESMITAGQPAPRGCAVRNLPVRTLAVLIF